MKNRPTQKKNSKPNIPNTRSEPQSKKKQVDCGGVLYETVNRSSENDNSHSSENTREKPDFNRNCINILSLNVCGIRNKIVYPEFKSLLDNHDIVCLTEAKLDDCDAL